MTLLDQYNEACNRRTEAAVAIYDYAVETLAQSVFEEYLANPAIEKWEAIADLADASEWVIYDYKAEAIYIGWECQTGKDYTELDLVESELNSASQRAYFILQESVAEALEDLISAS